MEELQLTAGNSVVQMAINSNGHARSLPMASERNTNLIKRGDRISATHRPCVPPTSMQIPRQSRNNVVLFGSSGAGKSSIINMLSPGDSPVAHVTKGLERGTLHSQYYDFDIRGIPVTLWDTRGLDEGEESQVPDVEAIVELYKLLLELGRRGGVSLLVFVVRVHRIKTAARANWELFRDIIYQGKLPTAMIITGLEEEENREMWWFDNKGSFEKHGIKLVNVAGAACITACRGKKRANGYVYEKEYDESREAVERLIQSTILPEPIPIEPVEWFTNVFRKAKELKWCGSFGLWIIEILFGKDGKALKRIRTLPGFNKVYVERLLKALEDV
ncbi:hypothetical protein NP233_g1055 [Leucocoprinus birnbaumii]|uniref:G domain-containing protein n=1 Tax=Leucocoprinus birnbaumii TaxID=56174 RepID=A0AAD5W602_9AGAR|nr:hypothetical protein NP233_g1055 [Leucocoprinus birnbaumii]